MSWRRAFLRQARSENAVRHRLNQKDFEYSHRLHYLQMVTEKLAKALLSTDSDAGPPAMTHRLLVRALQTLKGQPNIRRFLGYGDAKSFGAFIKALLPLTARIEALAPTFAGIPDPNPEYPWRETSSGTIVAPVDYSFEEFDPRKPNMIRLEKLLEALLHTSIHSV